MRKTSCYLLLGKLVPAGMRPGEGMRFLGLRPGEAGAHSKEGFRLFHKELVKVFC